MPCMASCSALHFFSGQPPGLATSTPCRSIRCWPKSTRSLRFFVIVHPFAITRAFPLPRCPSRVADTRPPSRVRARSRRTRVRSAKSGTPVRALLIKHHRTVLALGHELQMQSLERVVGHHFEIVRVPGVLGSWVG